MTRTDRKPFPFLPFIIWYTVDLSEPGQWYLSEGPTEPRRGNLINFSKIDFRGMPMTVILDRSTRDRQKSHSHVHFHADFAQNH